jgi:D-glycerate 3-kinase
MSSYANDGKLPTEKSVERDDYLPIMSAIAERASRSNRCLTVGISGAQGTGKSTLAALACETLGRSFGLATASVSLDDYYLPKAARLELSRSVHPLLVTRGAPGTHDVGALSGALRRLAEASAGEEVELLQFSKAEDDRRSETRRLRGKFDVVLFEGWCVGALAETHAELATPMNALEREHDRDGRFRQFVNAQLAQAYASLWTQLDMLVFLAAPDFAAVQGFREEQERELERVVGPDAPGLMNAQQLEYFIQHFERVTRHMLQTMPQRADVVVQLDRARRVLCVVARYAPFACERTRAEAS